MTAPIMRSPDNDPETRPAYLIFEFERRAYPIGGEPFTIGRAGSCDIVIREPAVSRIHAELANGPGGVTLKPFGATPTLVNSLPALGETMLRHGDQVDIGSAKLTFTEMSLPLGVSVVDKAGRKAGEEDVGNRRVTITNPILAGHANPNQSVGRRFFRPAVLLLILAVIAAFYFGAATR